jgi:4-amino-4-deoxy-L-arabinose transferase-like glycosyltransferase
MIQTNRSLFILLALAAFALLINVGSYGLLESSDARYAEISRMMSVSGDYLNPNLLEVHHYHKPPLTYQISALGIEIFGVNPFGARFFLQVAILLQLVLVYLLTMALFDKKEMALMATMIYFSFPLVLVASRNLTTDGFLTLFVLLGLYSWVKYRKEGRIKYLYVFTISLALGFMTKGPVVFIVPVIFIYFYNKMEAPKHTFNKHHFFAWSLFIVIGISWYLYLIINNPHFLDYFLGKQTVDRFSKNAFGRTEPFWYFLALAPLAGLPWLMVLPYMIKKQLERFKAKQIGMVLLLAVVIPLLFFSLSSSKRILYILPLYSMFAILSAYLLTHLSLSHVKVVNRVVFIYAVLFLSLFVLVPFVPITLNVPLECGFVSVGLIGLISWLYKTKKIEPRLIGVSLSFIIGMFLVIIGSIILEKNPLKSNSTVPVTAFIKEKKLDTREILVYNTRKPSIAFHLNKHIISLYDGSHDLDREVQFEIDNRWKEYLIDMKDKKEVEALKAICQRPSVLIVYKKQLQPHSEWMLANYDKKKVFGRWTIHY